MRFAILIKATKDSEAGVMPSQQLFDGLWASSMKTGKAGVMLAGEGLAPKLERARASAFRQQPDGKSMVHLPRPRTNPRPAVGVKSRGEATKVGQTLSQSDDGDRKIEIRQVFRPRFATP